MSPAIIFTTRGEIMALSKSNIPEESIEEVSNGQVTWDDLEYEAVFVDEEAPKETKKFYTISGKESIFEPTWEKFGMGDLDVGDTFEGRPEITIFENKDKSYDAARLRLMDAGEIVDLYVNYPKKDCPYVKNINKSFNWYRTCFDFIYSILRWKNEANVVDANGEEVNKFNKVNMENFLKFVDSMNRVGIKITEGNPDNDYNSFIIYKLE